MSGETPRPQRERVAAGWYPDPLGHPQLRWWDNHAWTEHVSDRHLPRVTGMTPPPLYASPPIPVRPDYAEPSYAEPTYIEVPHSTPPVRSAPFAGAEPTAVANRANATPPATVEHPAPTLSSAPVPEIGWAGAALTLNSVLTARVPMLLELEIVGHPRVHIDTRYDAFAWDLPLAEFPDAPMAVRVGVEAIDITAAPVFPLPGHSLDELLWRIGLIAFPDRAAPWLDPEGRHRLTRWPNLSTLQPTMLQMRQTAMLANRPFTVDELAAMTGATVEATRTLVNAFSLIGALETVVFEPAPLPQHPNFGVNADRGLFRRLRDRLGL